MMKLQTTLSPGAKVLTPGPSAEIVPEISCPITAGTGNFTSPFITWRSVWQTPQAVTLTRTSPERGTGTATSSIVSGRPTSESTAAFIGRTPGGTADDDRRKRSG